MEENEFLEEFRVIPFYEGYSVNRVGTIKSIERDIVLRQYDFNGYLIVDAFRGALTETLPVHRAVALAWINNPDPDYYTVVNHIDGVPYNNWYLNLEWSTYSLNNYHAVNTGLRPDNIRCLVREFYTGVVCEFPSVAQAAQYMGMGKTTGISRLRPKKFGALIAGHYEVRLYDEEEPWFYETRRELIRPSRFMVVVTYPNGDRQEVYTTPLFLKLFQLYKSPSKSFTALVDFARKLYPNITFELFDSYQKEYYQSNRNVKSPKRKMVKAFKNDEIKEFRSLRSCADYFEVDRSSIINRINKGNDLNGWTFCFQQLPA